MNFTGFDYIGTAQQLRRQLNELSNLSYDNMRISLFSSSVITSEEREIINSKIGREKMEHLIVKIIIPSLEQRFGKKYKSFLKVMEDNEDPNLQMTAGRLGRLEIYS